MRPNMRSYGATDKVLPTHDEISGSECLESQQTVDSQRRRMIITRIAVLLPLAFGVLMVLGAVDVKSQNQTLNSRMSLLSTTITNDCMDAELGPVASGYDVVAYFDLDPLSDGVLGSPEFTSIYKGYTFYFSTRENQDRFEISPETYVPAWGGFCSYGVSQESWWTAETMRAGVYASGAWRVVDGRLFLFHDPGVAALFAGLLPDAVRQGDAVWGAWGLDGFNAGCFNADLSSDPLGLDAELPPDLAARPEKHAPAVAAADGIATAAAAAAPRPYAAVVLRQEQQGGALLGRRRRSFLEGGDAADGWDSAACLDAGAGPVLEGYDVVAYFGLDPLDDGIQGSSEFTSVYQGFEFYFSSKENMEKFESDPEKYVPAWGGFCAYGVAEETWWTAETMSAGVVPDAWRIIDGRLFFFHDIGVAAWFAALLPDAIREGDATWHGWGLEGYNTNCFNTAGKTGGQLIQPDLAVRPERHAPAVAAVGAAEAAAGAVGAEGSG